jgi:hypothetical protein
MSETKPKPKQKHAPKALPVAAKPTDTTEQAKARAALLPSTNAVIVMEAYQGNIMGNDVDLAAMLENLSKTIQEVKEGDLSRLESMLLSQATALQTMFTSLARRAMNQEYLKHIDLYLSLSLKAQAQSRATISALVDLKYPRQATFIKQANVANGPQQVNNGPAPAGNISHAEEIKPEHPELLEHHHGERLDTGKTSKTSRADPIMETVGEVHRPKVTRRKS